MNTRHGFRWGISLAGFLMAVATSPTSAQIVNGGAQQGLPTVVPGQIGAQTNLTPQQLQMMMMMRAMQGRGRGVRTGYPQFATPQNPGFGSPFPTMTDDEPAATSRSSAEKRMDARKLREDKARAARDEAKAKKAKAVKKPKAKKPADDADQPQADQQQADRGAVDQAPAVRQQPAAKSN